jgi:hypothetical protein
MSGNMEPTRERATERRVVESTVFYHSDEIGSLVEALAEAQKTITNPTKNKTADVQPRTGRAFSYSYASLDSVMDAVRTPLAEQGIILTQILWGTKLVSMLAHKSGQWFKAETSLQFDSAQSMGGQTTYARRYQAMGLLGIAGEDDDDGISGDRNLTRLTPEEADLRKREYDARLARQQRGDQPIHPLLERAREVRDAEGASNLLQAWVEGASELEALRGDADWIPLLNETAGAIARGHGKTIGVAFKSALVAAKPADMDGLNKAWTGGWAADIATFQGADPAGFRALQELLTWHFARVKNVPPPEPRAPVSQQQAPVHTPPAAGGPPDQPPANLPGPEHEDIGAGMFAHHVFDAHGNADSELYTVPQEWADHYFRLLEELDGEDDTNLREYNVEAIENALASCELNKASIEALMFTPRKPQAKSEETPAPEQPRGDALMVPLDVPTTPTGSVDLGNYIRAIRAAVGQLNLAELRQWRRTNEPAWSSLPKAVGDAVEAELRRREDDIQKGGA